MKYFLQSSVHIMLGCFFLGCGTQETLILDEEISAIENGLTPAIIVKGEEPQLFSIYDRMKYHKVPGLSIAIVREGKIRWAKGYGEANTESGAMIDINTLFQAGSISKPLAALAALKLVEDDKVDLDLDVNSYLTNWKIEDNEFTKEEKVTLRRLLTHTAGMTVHGFPGYQQTDTFPSIEQVLNGEGNTPKIYVDTIPGTIWRYSGGGYTVMEKVVEDVSGLPLEEFIEKNILTPLGMDNSTFEQPLPTEFHANASAAYDSEGKLIEGLWHNYPEQAAAGLWTTPSDLAIYCIGVQDILAGKSDGFLSKETIEMMLTKHKGDWGLGPSLAWDADSLRFQHGGKNAGFTNNMMAFAHNGDALIIMTNADNGGRLISEIERSISNYYQWGISNSKIVDIIDLPVEQLSKLVGKYKLDFQVPDIGNYIIEITLKNDKLLVFDPNNNDTNVLSALDEFNFIDLDKGDEVVFQIQEDTSKIGLLWSNRLQFYKISE
ncbi:MAG: class A beta-lactamase-related serine hydrolase [Bacteroidetes bacterium]|nr:MAG: class A beta-lactamase-related serine hydrolase [Bacteroidota bacterium]